MTVTVTVTMIVTVTVTVTLTMIVTVTVTVTVTMIVTVTVTHSSDRGFHGRLSTHFMPTCVQVSRHQGIKASRHQSIKASRHHDISIETATIRTVMARLFLWGLFHHSDVYSEGLLVELLQQPGELVLVS